MPPKRKAAERGDEMELERESDFALSSPASSASSTCGSLTSEQLQQILANNQKALLEASHQSMATLLASLTPSAGYVSVPRIVPVKVPKWTDEDTPSDYFNKLEKALKHNGVDKSQWGHILPLYLTGRAQAAFAQVDPEALDDYDLVKATVLESLGDTPASADRKWWSLSRQSGEEAGSFYLRVRAVGIRRLCGLASREEILEKIVLSRFLSLLPAECYSSVVSRQPKNGLEAARLTQEFEETRSFSRRRNALKQDTNYHSQPYGRREQGGSSGGNFENFVSAPSDSGSHGAAGGVVVSGSGSQKEVVAGRGQSSDGCRNQESMGMRPVGRQGSDRKQVTCHGCGEVGHIRPNCPNRRVVEKDAGPGFTLDGFLAGRPVNALKIDTGSGRTLVHKDFIPGACYTERNVRLDSWKGGQFSRHRTANIEIKVGDVEDLVEVVVVDSLDCPAVLGNDLGSELQLKVLKLLLEKVEADPVNCDNNVVPMQTEELKVNFVEASMAQVDEVKVEVEQVAVAEAQSEEDPVPLSEIFDFSNEFFEEDPLPEFSVRNDESCVPIVKKCQIIEDQADEVAFGPVENKSVELSDVFNFSDSYFEPDPVLTSVSEVKQKNFLIFPRPRRVECHQNHVGSHLT